MLERLRLYCLLALIIFLPLSAWLVSLTGQNWVGLGRDLLLAIFMGISLFSWRLVRRPTTVTWLAIAFVLLTLISYFYRQDSIEQWLRGVRYLIEPLLLFITLQLFPISESHRPLWRALAVIIGLVILGAVIEFFAPQLLRATFDSSGRGYLGQIHLASRLTRLQSTLAGPNALGLFLMTTLLLFPIWKKTIFQYLTVFTGVLGLVTLLLTFSRSSYVGFLVGTSTLVTVGRRVLGRLARLLTTIFITLLVLIGVILIVRPQELTRTTSNSTRFEQYQRVWEQKSEIGWWGRGAGATGLVSVNRLDGGPNYYTENTYLDTYESLGILGLIVYLGFWIFLMGKLIKNKTIEGISVAGAVVGLVIAGVFINHYTGQAAIWLTLLFAGLTVAQSLPTRHS